MGVAVVGIPVVLGALYLGGWVLGVLVAAVAAAAAAEFYGLAEAKGVRPFAALGTASSGALVLLATAGPSAAALGAAALGVLLGVALLSLGGAVWLRWPAGEPLAAVSVTVAGVVYTGVTLAFVPVLRGLPDTAAAPAGGSPLYSMGFVLLPLLTTWAGDTAAYFAGRAWGRAPLAPAASPGKTVVGAVAGLAGSTLAAVALSLWLFGRVPAFALDVWTAAWLGLVLGAVAQVGDLAESVLKRDAGVKNSGSLLPGHGGVLDRTDSLLFSIPVSWGLLRLAGVIP